MNSLISMIQALWAHQAWADMSILRAVREQPDAYASQDVRKLLHHIVVVERFFLSVFEARPFDQEREGKVPDVPDGMEQLFQEAHEQGAAYTGRLDDAELSRAVDTPRFGDFHPAIRDALMQVTMHSEHHRGQCAMRLRAMGAKPPITDYIYWVRSGMPHL